MKIKIRLIALILAVVSVFTLPVSAEDNVFDSQWINMFDYGFTSYYDLSNFNSGRYQVRVFLPSPGTGYYIDAIIETDGTLTSIASNKTYLSIYQIDSKLYRIYGPLLGDYNRDAADLFFYDTSCNYLQFLSCNVSLSNYSILLDSCNISSSFNNSSKSTSFIDSNVSNIFSAVTGPSQSGLLNFNTNITFPNWRKYDYMDVSFSLRASSLDSINATFNDVLIPFEVTYINHNQSSPLVFDCDGWFDSTNEIYEEEYFTAFSDSLVNVQLRLDLTGLNRHFSGEPSIVINCGAQDINGCSITVHGCNGYLEMDVIDPVSFWLQSVKNTLTGFRSSMESWFSSVSDQLDQLINQDTSSSDDFNSQVDSDNEQLQDDLEVMDSVTKPAVDSIDPDVSDIVSGDEVLSYTSIFQALLNNAVILKVCIMSLTFAMVSYTIYGKRG